MAETQTFTLPEETDRLAYAYLTSDSGSYERTYLILDWGARRIRIEWRPKSQNAVTFYEWHGHQTALVLPPNVDARRLVEWLADHQADLTAIADGYESAWDGSNHVARFSEAARAALEDIEIDASHRWDDELALPDGEGVWAASEWLYDSRHEHVNADSTDAEIEQTAVRLDAEALAEGKRVEGTIEYLQSVREELQDAAAEEAE